MNFVIDQGATLIIQNGADINCEPNSELICEGECEDENGEFDWDDTACVLAKGQGIYSNTSSKNLVIDNNAIFATEAGGTVELPDADVIIKSGSHWQLTAGATVKVHSARNIIVEDGAYIHAVGTWDQKINFTSANGNPLPSDWGGIFMYSDSNYFEHCIIEGSNSGLKFYGPSSGNIVDDCGFFNNNDAIVAEYAGLEVRESFFKDNNRAFALINCTSEYGGILLDGNTVRKNDFDGIYSSNSVVDIFRTRLEKNGLAVISSYHGITAVNSSDIAFGSRSWSTVPSEVGGFNTIRANQGTGIYVSNSQILLGKLTVNNSTNFYSTGSNSIHANGKAAGTYNGKDIYNDSAVEIIAKKNYWGGEPDASQFYGQVKTFNWLASPPAGTFKLSASRALNADDDARIKRERIKELRASITGEPANPRAAEALMAIYSFIRTDRDNILGEDATVFDYLQSIQQAYGQYDVGKHAIQLMITECLRQENFAAAIQHARLAVKKSSGTLQQEAMSQLIMLLLRTGQTESARNLFKRYSSDYPGDVSMLDILQRMFEHIEYDLAFAGKIQSGPGQPETANDDTEISIPQEFSVGPNFPNPFNPTTEITYALPQNGRVSLQIFDALGKQVRLLVDTAEPAGEYRIRWDGTNEQGFTVASGIYFYRISYESQEASAQAFVQNGKMSLLR